MSEESKLVEDEDQRDHPADSWEILAKQIRHDATDVDIYAPASYTDYRVDIDPVALKAIITEFMKDMEALNE